MKDNLKMDIMSDPTTLKKTWEEGRVAKLAEANPSMRRVFAELGLIVLGEDDSVRSVSYAAILYMHPCLSSTSGCPC
jgi:hypothetical protein